ncbi:phosphate ABC transporter substrate-binding protein PstS [Nakamurella leprariae]|uniref:phosphate ABC transporter substrate-binding protein PstS n=1 Tax=Nakamurella leprariae TaxID=2803911 RepID=UPI002E2903F0|nr:phosphate ABC transporter substrate-binding protein PstS [Nakamurella leprariae]
MKNTRTRVSTLLALAAAGALTLSACGSDDNTATPSSSSSSSSSASSGSTSTGATSSSSGTTGSGDTTTFEGAGFTCAEGDLRSSGSTAQGRVMEQWIADFNALCGANVNAYGGGGSGKGVQDFVGNQTDWAGSDSALNADQQTQAEARCEGNPAWNLPMVVGPIAMAYNLDGVDSLVMTPAVLAGIFDGTITNWNAPEIAEINSGASLPDLAIQAVHRAEDSGTTANFTRYLKAAAGDAWGFEPGNAWQAPGGVAAQGSDGVSQQVEGTPGSIGYVEWGFAEDAGLGIAQIDNGGGAVELTAETAGNALAAAEVVGEGNDLALKLDYATQEADAYPAVLVTYEIVCSAGNGDNVDLLKSFLGYMATDGQASMEELGAAPLPAELQTRVVESIQAVS